MLTAGRVLCGECKDTDGLEPLPWRLAIKCDGASCSRPADEVCSCGVVDNPAFQTHLFCWPCHLDHHLDRALEVEHGSPQITADLCSMKGGPELCQRCGMPAELWVRCEDHGRDYYCEWCWEEIRVAITAIFAVNRMPKFQTVKKAVGFVAVATPI